MDASCRDTENDKNIMSKDCRKRYQSEVVYVSRRYLTIAPDSNIFIPVFGSSMYGTWNLDVFSLMTSLFEDPLPE